MTPQEEEQISRWNSELTVGIQIGLRVSEDRRSREFIAFCEKLSCLAPKVTVVRKAGEHDAAPTIMVGQGLRYQAIPLGMELEPFLEALSPNAQRISKLPVSVQEKVSRIKRPAFLKLYILRHCNFCPSMVRKIVHLTGGSDLIRCTIIDGNLFPEMAQLDKVRAVPTLMLEEKFRWTASFRVEEIVDVILSRDPVKLGRKSLERMLMEGEATRLAKMMLDKDRVFPVFLDLLTDRRFPVRLGAMVTMEQIADRNPRLAAQAIEPLWKHLKHMEDSIKGDILYIFGLVGTDDVIWRLQMVLNGAYSDEVKEAAVEALEKIANRSQP